MIPAILNSRGGSANQARVVLEAAREFVVTEVVPDTIHDTIKTAMREKPARIAVSGGDGTIATAAAEVAGSETALAILPGGTLNHFARDHGIPVDLEAAAHVATHGQIVEADVAYAGDRLFLNTSSVGAYVTYVRLRERLERYVGYRLASVLAAFRLLLTIKPVSLQLEVDGTVRRYDTPLVFIGVGERELKAPTFGARIPHGRRCLHVMVIRERRAARLMALAFAAAARGVTQIAKTPQLDSYFVDRCTIGVAGKHRRVALDGEIVHMAQPIEYRIETGVLRIVIPDMD